MVEEKRMRPIGSTPNCPALACAGGNIVRKIEDPSNYGIPQAIWDEKEYSSLWRCGYCGFIWYQTTVQGEIGHSRERFQLDSTTVWQVQAL